MNLLPVSWRVISSVIGVAVLVTALSGCGQSGEANSPADVPSERAAAAEATPTVDPGRSAEAPTLAPDPVPFIPSGQVGSAEAYTQMISRLEAEIPPALRAEVPWPDLRTPDPAAAQQQIFDMWIWMTENNPDPILIDVLAAPGSPTRERIAPIFWQLDLNDQIEVRTGAPYRAFDHVVVTMDSAGLPLWLIRDVPENAVVVYYSDNSGPIDVRDRETAAVFETMPGVETRSWVSLMVPTEVGWLLWRDELIDPSDSELEIPDLTVPGPASGQPKPQV